MGVAAPPGLLTTAVALAERGYVVHPLCGVSAHQHRQNGQRVPCVSPGKVPVLKGWQRVEPPDAGQVRAWWTRQPPPGIGVRTGGGLLVVDVDRHGDVDGLANLIALFARFDVELPPPLVETGSGGAHWWFRVADGGFTPRNTAGRLGPGIDTRGDGGQVVAPPSPHASGQAYRWVDGLPPPLAELPPAPAALLQALRGAVPPPTPPAPPANAPLRDAGARALWRAALEGWASEDKAGRGRNDSGNRAAFLAGQLHAAGRADGPALLAQVRAHALAMGLREGEVETILRSDETGGYARGLRQPLESRPTTRAVQRARWAALPSGTAAERRERRAARRRAAWEAQNGRG